MPTIEHEINRPSSVTSPIYKEINRRIIADLNAVWKTMGPLTREELGVMMDGAVDAVMEWTPTQKKEAK